MFASSGPVSPRTVNCCINFYSKLFFIWPTSDLKARGVGREDGGWSQEWIETGLGRIQGSFLISSISSSPLSWLALVVESSNIRNGARGQENS